MKFLKLLFSKIFISFLALAIQLAVFFTVLFVFEQYVVLLQIASYILGLIIVLGIIGKKEPPEFKTPWLVIILILPFFGLVIYSMFANSNMSTKQYKKMVDITCRCKKYSELSPDENEELLVELEKNTGIEYYLRRNSFSRGHVHNKADYFRCGEDFYSDLLAELEKAEKFIFMEYFIIEHGIMWDGIHEILKRKAGQGVEVRFMYDDIGSAGLVSGNYYKKLGKEGINCIKFNPFRPVLSGIHNNRDHRKITVIDGKCAYTGGMNIADEYINKKKRFGYWKDTAVKIQGSAVGNFTAMFLQMFDASAKSFSDYSKYLDIEYERFEDEGYIHPFGDGPKPFYKELVGSNNYINIINSAKEYVYVSTPYLIPDYNLVSALRNAAYRGVDVRIITPSIPDKKIVFNMSRSNYNYLLEAGVRIYEYSPGFIHAKQMIADGTTAFVGTVNLDYRSLVHHYECGAVLYKSPCIANIKADFDKILSLSYEITADNFKMSFIGSLLNAVLNLFSPML